MNPANITEVLDLLLTIRDKLPVFGRIEKATGQAVVFYPGVPAPDGAIMGSVGEHWSTWGSSYVDRDTRRPSNGFEIAQVQQALRSLPSPALDVGRDLPTLRRARTR